MRRCSTSCFTVVDVAAVPKTAGNSHSNCCSNAVSPQVAACGPVVFFSVMYGTAEAAAAIHMLGVAGKLSLTADAAGDVASGLGISLQGPLII
jgi:hypothetical protein